MGITPGGHQLLPDKALHTIPIVTIKVLQFDILALITQPA